MNGPFSVILGSNKGLLAINDRLKLRSLTAATKGNRAYFASEESAIRVICPHPEKVWSVSGADIVVIDGFRGGTGAAPTRIRDNVGIPIELALAAADQRLRDEGIRSTVSLVAAGSFRCSSDVIKAIALGADAVYIASAPLIAMGCHMCQTCNTGKSNWGIATQRPDLTRRLNPEIAHQRVENLLSAWNHEMKEIMGGMGINSVDSLRGNRLMLRGIGLSDRELQILGIKHAGE